MNGTNDRGGSDRLNVDRVVQRLYELVVDTVSTAGNGCVVRDERCRSIDELCCFETDAGLDASTAEKSSCGRRPVDGGNGREPVTNPLLHFTMCVDCPGTGARDGFPERKVHQSCATERKFQLECLASRKRALEEKVEEQERANADVVDLKLQLETLRRRIGVDGPTDDRRPQQCFDDVSDHMDALLSMYDRVLGDVDKLKRENHQLQCRAHTKTCEQTHMIDTVKRLENDKTVTAKCVQELCDNVRDEKARVETSTRRVADLERAIMCKEAETVKAQCEMKAAQAEADGEIERRRKLQRDNEELCRELRELQPEGQRRAAALAALRKKGPKRLVQVVRAIDETAEKLTGARAAIQGLADKRGRAVDEHRRLLIAREEAACRANNEHRALKEQGCRLDDQIRLLSRQFDEARTHGRRLADEANVAAEQLIGLTDAASRLEKRWSHERLVLSVKQTMAEGVKAALEMHDSGQGLKMKMIGGERLDE